MRKYNKQLNKDVTLLKELHAKKDKTEFRKMKAVVMKRHNISKATVYREMKKEVPGFYKTPNYTTHKQPITEKEKRMVRELLLKQHTLQDIVHILEKQTGESYNWDRVNRIREAIDRGEVIVDSKEGKSKKAKGKKLKTESTNPLPTPPEGRLSEDESGFGEDVRVFLERALGVDKMYIDTVVSINVKGKVYRLGNQAVKEMMMIAANSEFAGGTDVADHMIVTALHGTAELVRLYSQGKAACTGDYLNALRIQKEYRKAYSNSFSPDFKVTDACLQEAAPHLSEAERLILIYDKHRLTEGATEASDTDMHRLRELTAEESEANM